MVFLATFPASRRSAPAQAFNPAGLLDGQSRTCDLQFEYQPVGKKTKVLLVTTDTTDIVGKSCTLPVPDSVTALFPLASLRQKGQFARLHMRLRSAARNIETRPAIKSGAFP